MIEFWWVIFSVVCCVIENYCVKQAHTKLLRLKKKSKKLKQQQQLHFQQDIAWSNADKRYLFHQFCSFHYFLFGLLVPFSGCVFYLFGCVCVCLFFIRPFSLVSETWCCCIVHFNSKFTACDLTCMIVGHLILLCENVKMWICVQCIHWNSIHCSLTATSVFFRLSSCVLLLLLWKSFILHSFQFSFVYFFSVKAALLPFLYKNKCSVYICILVPIWWNMRRAFDSLANELWVH